VLPKRHEYTRERWEIDAFKKLKTFGPVIRGKLGERHAMLNRATEETVSGSIGEITGFMGKCDADMERLRSDFVPSSSQDQHIVDQLSDQQVEHIGQMTKDCDMIQKRIEELLKRFGQQQKTVLANQEKYIGRLREDMLSEVKAAVTFRKRESSKRMVQKLVTLLDEL
jgi:hypothetical protein